MGGFRLIGPRYVFENVPPPLNEACFCAGYIAEITAATEVALLGKPGRRLNVIDLPSPHQRAMQNYHLGEELRYTIRERKVTDKVPEAYDPWGASALSHVQPFLASSSIGMPLNW